MQVYNEKEQAEQKETQNAQLEFLPGFPALASWMVDYSR